MPLRNTYADPLATAAELRRELQRARKMAEALAGNIDLLLREDDRALPFVMAVRGEVLDDDDLRLSASLQSARKHLASIGQDAVDALAMGRAA